MLCFVLCVCFHSIYSGHTSSLDVPAGVTQEEGHTGFLIHLLPSGCHLFHFREVVCPALPCPARLVERRAHNKIGTPSRFLFAPLTSNSRAIPIYGTAETINSKVCSSVQYFRLLPVNTIPPVMCGEHHATPYLTLPYPFVTVTVIIPILDALNTLVYPRICRWASCPRHYINLSVAFLRTTVSTGTRGVHYNITLL